MEDFATPIARNRGRPTRLCWRGRRRRESVALVCCMCCNKTRSNSIDASRSSGLSSASLAKTTLRSRSCCHIRRAFALWISALTCLITIELFERSRRKHRCGGREPQMDIMRALSDFFLTNSSAVSLARLCPVIGRKILRGHFTSTFGSAYQKRRIREWQRFTLRKEASRPSQQNSIAILSRPARWRERRLPRHMA